MGKERFPYGAAMLCLAVALLAAACGGPRKLSLIQRERMGAGLSIAGEDDMAQFAATIPGARRDTLTVRDLDGREVIIMKAIRDEDGEMVATDVLDAAVVTARFRNVAERHGRVDISFNITVPEAMQDSRWQLRFHPDLYVMEDSVRLDPVLITGRDYRKAQLKGYQQYERFLNSIISDTTTFINRRQLSIFIQRNIPELYAMRSDSTEVDDDTFRRILEGSGTAYSMFGVSRDQAVEHYTDKFARWRNRRRMASRDRRYGHWVKDPIVTEGIRLDTVMQDVSGDYVYCYTTTIATRPKLRKADVVLSGEIRELDRVIYSIPRSEPLTFYISSLSAFADPAQRYMTRIIERRAEANTSCWIDFEKGRDAVREDYSDNAREIARIRGNILDLLQNTTYDLDSVTVSASSSPEGSMSHNASLSQRRSRAVADYMDRYIRHVQDSLEMERGFSVDEDGNVHRHEKVRIPLVTRSTPENWVGLDALVRADTVLTDAQKEEYFSLAGISDPDRREERLQRTDSYGYLRESLYPRVRTVRFDFYLHRKGMVEERVQTTEIDTTYMKGVQAIRDRDYQEALRHLGPYGDYNTAVAYCALERNLSAIAILESLERTAEVNYMLAVCYSREGRIRDAVEAYTQSCQQNPSFVSRGNLDPEISALIRAYGLNREDGDEFEYSF